MTAGTRYTLGSYSILCKLWVGVYLPVYLPVYPWGVQVQCEKLTVGLPMISPSIGHELDHCWDSLSTRNDLCSHEKWYLLGNYLFLEIRISFWGLPHHSELRCTQLGSIHKSIQPLVYPHHGLPDTWVYICISLCKVVDSWDIYNIGHVATSISATSTKKVHFLPALVTWLKTDASVFLN